MSFNFLPCDREQRMLLPPSVGEWLPPEHVAWCVIEAVDQFDLSAFLAEYRADGRGGAAFDPAMMVALLLYSYCVGERSSRQIERLCLTDVAFRVVCANQRPDHVTISRFRKGHRDRLKVLFDEVLRLCAEAGLVKVGTVALDGRKVAADAALDQNRTLDSIGKEIEKMFDEADAADAAEDELFGADRRGDETPAEMADPRSRKARFARAKADLEQRQAKRQAAHDTRVAERAERETQTGKKLRGRKPKAPEPEPEAKANVTDPDSRIMKTRKGFIQGYNAQAVVTEDQIVVAAKVVQDANDVDQLHPMIDEAKANIAAAGIDDEIEVALADAGYASDDNFEQIDPDGPEFYVATKNRHRARDDDKDQPPPRGRIPKDLTARERMTRKLRTAKGKATYKKRSQTVEPVFGQHHTVHRFDRFMQRGLEAADSEFQLVNAAHNLLKYHRAMLAGA
jgi:transposase